MVEFPKKLSFLFDPAPGKVIYGGRYGLKTWSVARYFALSGAMRKRRILCVREIMKSIAESVHQTLEDQIELVGLGDFYTIEKAAIYGKNGTEYAFTGLRDSHNLKSYEGFDACWIEEANNVSKRSWDILLPTIRVPGHEFVVTFNPELDTDETYKRFVLNTPKGWKAVETSWRDNPFLSDDNLQKIENVRKRPLAEPDDSDDNDDYLNIYGGQCRQALEGAIYAKEMRDLMLNRQITRVPYTPGVPVQTWWDLGISDCTSIWFTQSIAFEHRFIDFVQMRNQPLAYYLAELQKRNYVYSYHNLPHDGRRRDLGTGKSIENHMTEAGFKVKIVPDIGLTNGINATRNLFARAYFDSDKCTDGLNCLRRYTWKVDPNTKIFSKEPLHDDYSHGADSFRMAAVGLTEPERVREKQQKRNQAMVTTWG